MMMSSPMTAVKRVSRALVRPSEPTPSGLLPLSVIDRAPWLRFPVRTLLVFTNNNNKAAEAGGREPGKTMREAISKMLVLYYPLAGRIVEQRPGELQLDCTADGVCFVEASADCSLEDADHFEHPFKISPAELLPDFCSDVDTNDMPMLIQVTKFQCGGLVLGLVWQHTMADGLGASLFINTIAEFAKGLHHPAAPMVEPIWSREAIPNPRNLGTPTPPTLPVFYLQHSEINLAWAYIKRLKDKYLDQTGHSCSTFDCVVASLWQCRTRAIGFDPDTDMNLCIFANIRPMLGIGDGYYGNCVFLLRVSATCSMVSQSPTVEVIKLIKKAKAEFGEKVRKWAKGESEEDPNDVRFSYETLLVTDWTHLGFKGADFGWGTPVRIVPVLPASFYMNLLVLGLASAKSNGDYRVMTRCVTEEHLAAFQDEMMNLK